MANTNPQGFIGGLIIGKVIESVASKAITVALDRVVRSPSTSMTQEDVPVVKAAIEQAVKHDTQARIEYATDTEPWYQSRTILGTVVGTMGAVANLYQLYNDGVMNSWDDYSPSIMILGGVLFALYGRVFSKKPLGR